MGQENRETESREVRFRGPLEGPPGPTDFPRGHLIGQASPPVGSASPWPRPPGPPSGPTAVRPQHRQRRPQRRRVCPVQGDHAPRPTGVQSGATPPAARPFPGGASRVGGGPSEGREGDAVPAHGRLTADRGVPLPVRGLEVGRRCGLPCGARTRPTAVQLVRKPSLLTERVHCGRGRRQRPPTSPDSARIACCAAALGHCFFSETNPDSRS
jgi:hypothetical protein